MRANQFLSETARMSAAVKLQRAFEREQAKSTASRQRGKDLLNPPKKDEPKPCEHCGKHHEGELDEAGKASRALCTSGRPDADLGASNLASCKSQGLRARDGEKSHLITAGKRNVRVTVGGKKIKGEKYGGPLPDYGTRKNQK